MHLMMITTRHEDPSPCLLWMTTGRITDLPLGCLVEAQAHLDLVPTAPGESLLCTGKLSVLTRIVSYLIGG